MTVTLEITPEYFVSGDFDSRKRYLRADTAGPIAICDGITWGLGSTVVRAPSQSNTPWCPWRFDIPGFLSYDRSTQTFNGSTVTTSPAVQAPSSALTKVNF